MGEGLKTFLIVFWAVVALVVCGVLAVFAMGKGWIIPRFSPLHYRTADTLVKSETIQVASGVKSLELSFSSCDVEICRANGDNIVVEQWADKDLPEKNLISVKKTGDRVRITSSDSDFIRRFLLFFRIGYAQRIKLFIPDTFDGSVDISTSSGDVRFLDRMNFDSLKVATSSGNIEAESTVSAKKLEAGVEAGNIEISTLEADSYSIKTTSGNITVDSVKGEGDIEVTSGDIYICYSAITGKCSLRSVSGDITAAIGIGQGLRLSASCVVGNISSDFALDYSSSGGTKAFGSFGDSPDAELDISTVSGDICIKKG